MEDDEDETENHQSIILEKLFKVTIESASNIHSDVQKTYMINIIGTAYKLLFS